MLINQQTEISNGLTANSVREKCARCNNFSLKHSSECVTCQRRFRKESTVKIIGVFLCTIGFAVLAFMIWLSLWTFGVISQSGNPHSAPRFNGSADDLRFVIFIYGSIILLSLGITAAGIWQVIFGRRNKIIVFVVLASGIIFRIVMHILQETN